MLCSGAVTLVSLRRRCPRLSFEVRSRAHSTSSLARPATTEGSASLIQECRPPISCIGKETCHGPRGWTLPHPARLRL